MYTLRVVAWYFIRAFAFAAAGLFVLTWRG